MESREVVIVIPVHKEQPSPYELISFRQCFRILGSHSIVVVAPQNINLEVYRSAIPDFKTIFIHPKWQSSILNYNKLKLSQFFYKMFEEYEYMLTYELDAFVFDDKLKYWCDKGYDYIGAPWFEGFGEPTHRLIGVGNSGFSLRKIDSVAQALRKIQFTGPGPKHSGFRSKMQQSVKQLFFRLRHKVSENSSIQNASELNEDIVISRTIPEQVKEFRIAPVSDAIEFSFEVRPDYLFQINYQRLPMGCHAWWRYNLNFWKPHIEKYGYQL